MAPTTLLTLPEELQASIYEIVLAQQSPIRPHISRFANDQRRVVSTFSLFATCQKILRIAKAVYYGKNTFILEGCNEDITTEVVKALTFITPSTLNLCKNVIIELTFTDSLRHRAGCAETGEESTTDDIDYFTEIRANFVTKELEGNLRSLCCAEEQMQYKLLVEHLEEVMN